MTAVSLPVTASAPVGSPSQLRCIQIPSRVIPSSRRHPTLERSSTSLTTPQITQHKPKFSNKAHHSAPSPGLKQSDKLVPLKLKKCIPGGFWLAVIDSVTLELFITKPHVKSWISPWKDIYHLKHQGWEPRSKGHSRLDLRSSNWGLRIKMRCHFCKRVTTTFYQNIP